MWIRKSMMLSVLMMTFRMYGFGSEDLEELNDLLREHWRDQKIRIQRLTPAEREANRLAAQRAFNLYAISSFCNGACLMGLVLVDIYKRNFEQTTNTERR